MSWLIDIKQKVCTKSLDPSAIIYLNTDTAHEHIDSLELEQLYDVIAALWIQIFGKPCNNVELIRENIFFFAVLTHCDPEKIIRL